MDKSSYEKEVLNLFHQLTKEEKINYLVYLQCLVTSQPDASSVRE